MGMVVAAGRHRIGCMVEFSTSWMSHFRLEIEASRREYLS